MILFPLFFGFIFLLVLTFKLVGGPVAWWVVILLGALFVVPIVIIAVYEVIQRYRH